MFLVVIFGLACSPPPRGPESQFTMGTLCTVNLFERGDDKLYSEVFRRINELEGILSANREGTDLDRVNMNAGLAPVRVSPELIEVLDKAIIYAEKSGGFFDPTIGPLVKLWGIGSDSERIPDEEEILEALDLVNYREIEINHAERTVFLKRRGMSLDLGAIAKGYTADEVAKLAAQEGAKRAIIDLGGDIYALGERQAGKKADTDETYWRIGIQDPRDNRGNYIGILRVKNSSVVTSGNYERFFEQDGKRYNHILSVEDGFPVENGLISVTITADRAADADALSTAAFALGWERGRELIAQVNGAEGIFVFDDLSVRLTGDLEKAFTLTAAEYRVESKN